jgi:hypothetical protein
MDKGVGAAAVPCKDAMPGMWWPVHWGAGEALLAEPGSDHTCPRTGSSISLCSSLLRPHTHQECPALCAPRCRCCAGHALLALRARAAQAGGRPPLQAGARAEGQEAAVRRVLQEQGAGGGGGAGAAMRVSDAFLMQQQCIRLHAVPRLGPAHSCTWNEASVPRPPIQQAACHLASRSGARDCAGAHLAHATRLPLPPSPRPPPRRSG